MFVAISTGVHDGEASRGYVPVACISQECSHLVPFINVQLCSVLRYFAVDLPIIHFIIILQFWDTDYLKTSIQFCS